MRAQLIIAIILIVLSSLVVFGLAYYQKTEAGSIYWLIPFWIIILFVSLRMWSLRRAKIIFLLHALVFLSGFFSFFSYQLFKKLSDLTPLSSSKFTAISNLMFNSETALYIMIYGGVILLFLDLFYFSRKINK